MLIVFLLFIAIILLSINAVLLFSDKKSNMLLSVERMMRLYSKEAKKDREAADMQLERVLGEILKGK